MPGKIRLEGVKNGACYSETIETTGTTARLTLHSETGDTLRLVQGDVAIVTARLLDSKNRWVPTASDRIDFRVEHGIILGVGNGHPSSHEPDQTTEPTKAHRNAFGGLAQIIIRPNASGQPLRLIATTLQCKEEVVMEWTVLNR